MSDTVERPAPSLAALASVFCWVAIASFGGGLSAWSHEVVVSDKGWLDEDEFLGAMTLCRMLPGANQVNLAIYVGMKLRGLAGAAAAVMGLITLPVLIVLGLGWLYFRYGHLPATQSVLHGITPVAVAMTFAMVWHTGQKCLRSWPAWALFGASLLLSAVLRIPLPLMLALLVPPAMWWAWPRART